MEKNSTSKRRSFKYQLKLIEFKKNAIQLDEVDNGNHELIIDTNENFISIRLRLELSDSTCIDDSKTILFFFYVIDNINNSILDNYYYDKEKYELRLMLNQNNELVSSHKSIYVSSNKTIGKYNGDRQQKLIKLDLKNSNLFEFNFTKFDVPQPIIDLYNTNYINLAFFSHPKFISSSLNLFKGLNIYNDANPQIYELPELSNEFESNDQLDFNTYQHEQLPLIDTTNQNKQLALPDPTIDNTNRIQVNVNQYSFESFCANFKNCFKENQFIDCYNDNFEKMEKFDHSKYLEAKFPCGHLNITININQLKDYLFICPSPGCNISYKFSFCLEIFVSNIWFYHDLDEKNCNSFINLIKFKSF